MCRSPPELESGGRKRRSAQLLCNRQNSRKLDPMQQNDHFRCHVPSGWSQQSLFFFTYPLELQVSSLTTVSAAALLSPGAPPSTPRMSRPQSLRSLSSRSGSWQKQSASRTDNCLHQNNHQFRMRRMGTPDAQIIHSHTHQFPLFRTPFFAGLALQFVPSIRTHNQTKAMA